MFTYGSLAGRSLGEGDYWLTAPQLTPALPHSGHRLPQFFVGDVEIPLRLLDVGMAEHQLDRADANVLRQEATRAS